MKKTPHGTRLLLQTGPEGPTQGTHYLDLKAHPYARLRVQFNEDDYIEAFVEEDGRTVAVRGSDSLSIAPMVSNVITVKLSR